MLLDFVVIVRGEEEAFGDSEVDVCCDVLEELWLKEEGVVEPVAEGETVAAFWIALCARKAAKKLEIKGRLFDMVSREV